MKQYCVECDKFVDAIEKPYELTLLSKVKISPLRQLLHFARSVER